MRDSCENTGDRENAGDAEACPDCVAPPGVPHRRVCDVERRSGCGRQKLTCGCEGPDPSAAAWTGEYPPALESCPDCGVGPPEDVRPVPEKAPSPSPDLSLRRSGSFVGRHVRKGFRTCDPTMREEQMWVRVKALIDRGLIGVLRNDPLFCSDLRRGDRVVVAMGEIECVDTDPD